MKKLFIIAATLMLAAAASAVQPLTSSFLSGTSVIISNNTTVSFGDTGVIFTTTPANGGMSPFAGTNITPSTPWTTNLPLDNVAYSFTATNIIWGMTNSGTTFSNTWLTVVSATQTNPTTGQTGVGAINGGAFRDVATTPNGYGDPASLAINASMIGSGAASSNVLTFTFAKILSGTNVCDDSNNRFVFAVTNALGAFASLTNRYTIATNMSTALQVGAHKWRLVSVASSSVANSGFVVLRDLSLNGWTPSVGN